MPGPTPFAPIRPRQRRKRPEIVSPAPPPPAPKMTILSVQATGGPFCTWTFSEPFIVLGTDCSGFKVDNHAMLFIRAVAGQTLIFQGPFPIGPGLNWELTDVHGLIQASSGHAIAVPENGITV